MSATKGTLNQVELIGWLGNDPEQRHTPSAASLIKFSIATKRYMKNTTTGDITYETDWIDVEVWNQLADDVSSMLHKGSRVLVVGSLQINKWEDGDGNPRKRYFVRADEVLVFNGR